MRKIISAISLILLAFSGFCGNNNAIILPDIFCDNMVVQRNMPIKVWGKCAPKAKVEGWFANGKQVTEANDTGAFCLIFPAMKADGVEHELKIKVKKEIVKISGVLVGDVYFAAGQSNMAFRLQACTKADIEAAKADADYPQIRHYEVAKIVSGGKILNASDTPWQKAGATTVTGWSAVAFYAARDMYKHNKVPVGIINCSQGSASADAYIRSGYYTSHLDLAEIRPESFTDIRSNYKNPSVLYTSMVSKVVGYPLAAVWWYQAEANSNRAFCYDQILTALIGNIREDWNQKDLPFIFVQLPGYGKTKEDWVTTRQKQLEVYQSVANTGMVVAIDMGEEFDIHPKNKKVVGERLVLVTREKVFHENVPVSPIAQKAILVNGVATVTFKPAALLKVVGEHAPEVELAGFDGVFHPAEIKVDSTMLQAWSNEVKNPRYIRYAWKNYPQPNIYSEVMLPVAPFFLTISE